MEILGHATQRHYLNKRERQGNSSAAWKLTLRDRIPGNDSPGRPGPLEASRPVPEPVGPPGSYCRLCHHRNPLRPWPSRQSGRVQISSATSKKPCSYGRSARTRCCSRRWSWRRGWSSGGRSIIRRVRCRPWVPPRSPRGGPCPTITNNIPRIAPRTHIQP